MTAAPGLAAGTGGSPGRDLADGATALQALALCVAMNALARGLAESWPVFLAPISADLGLSRSAANSVYTVFVVSGALAAPVAGRMIDAVGLRVAYLSGLILFGVGLAAASLSQGVWPLRLFVGVFGGLGAASLGMVAASVLIARWFSRRLSIAMGVAYAGLGVGVMLLSPLAQWLIELWGWRGAYQAMGAAAVTAAVALIPLPWRRWAAGASDITAAQAAARAGGGGDWRLSAAMRESAFWALFGVLFCAAVAIYSVTPQSVAYLIERGFSPIEAASAFGMAGFLSVAGMIATGALADRFGRRPVATFSFGLTLAGIAALAAQPVGGSAILLMLFVLCLGLSQGARGPVVSSIAARLYAGPGLGAIYGVISMGVGLGAGLGNQLSGWFHDATDGYAASFALGALGALGGMSLFWLSRPLATGGRG